MTLTFHDTVQSFEENVDGLVLVRKQEITDDFLDHLRRTRDASAARAGEYHQVASVPAHLVDIWMGQGFNVYEEKAADIVARLRKHDLDVFVTSNKRLGR